MGRGAVAGRPVGSRRESLETRSPDIPAQAGDLPPGPWRLRALLLALMVPNLFAWLLAAWTVIDVIVYENVDLQPWYGGALLLVAALAASAATLWSAARAWHTSPHGRVRAGVAYVLACLALWAAEAGLIALAASGPERLAAHVPGMG